VCVHTHTHTHINMPSVFAPKLNWNFFRQYNLSASHILINADNNYGNEEKLTDFQFAWMEIKFALQYMFESEICHRIILTLLNLKRSGEYT